MPQTKKEFITYWSPERVALDRVSPGQVPPDTDFFHHQGKAMGGLTSSPFIAVIPDNISFNELITFLGHKTKVTIEIIP